MIEWLEHIDRELFLLLNGLHSPLFDWLMARISAKLTWAPLYALILFWIFRRFGWKRALVAIFTIVLLITAVDQTALHVFKNTFERFRPSHNLELQGLVHHVDGYKGGQYGFVSNHAANSFGLAVFLALLFRLRWFSWAILGWAALVSYSRIYLGVHYPSDIVGGALLGSLIAYLAWLLYGLLCRKLMGNVEGHKKNRP